MKLTVETFLARFPEFSAVNPTLIEIAIADSAPYISKDAYGALFPQAWAFLAAAFLVGNVQTSGEDGDGVGGSAASPIITKQQAGKVGFETAGSTNVDPNDFDTWLAQTVYGRRYMAARDTVAVGALVVPGGLFGGAYGIQ